MGRAKMIENPVTEQIQPFTVEQMGRAEEALRLLAPVKDLVARCERCDIPVSAARQDCDACEAWFQRIIAEFSGPHSPLPKGA